MHEWDVGIYSHDIQLRNRQEAVTWLLRPPEPPELLSRSCVCPLRCCRTALLPPPVPPCAPLALPTWNRMEQLGMTLGGRRSSLYTFLEQGRAGAGQAAGQRI